MQISNMQICKGSVIFVKDPSLPSHLKNRPLIVVSDYIPVYGTVWAVEVTSQKKPGILVHLHNYTTGKACGDCELSYVKPYNIFSISVSTVVSCIGVIPPHIMKEIDKSIDFFLGRSEVIPPYLKGLSDYYSVEFTDGSDLGTSYMPREPLGASYLNSYNPGTHQNASPRDEENSSFLSKIKKGVEIQKFWKKDKISFTSYSDICEEDWALIVSRSMTNKQICEHYGVTRGTADKLKEKITKISIEMALTNLSKIIADNKTLKDLDMITILGLYIVNRFEPEFFNKFEKEIIVEVRNISAMLEKSLISKDGRAWFRVKGWYQKNINATAIFNK